MRHLLALLVLVNVLTYSTAAPPNIVYILCDDLGVGDLKSFNDESKIPTPNLDRLATEGMRFSDAHSGSAVCTPTRYGILCGRYAWRTRLQNGVLGGLSPRLIRDEVWTVPEVLHQRNYHSACIGKWHLGLDWQRPKGKNVSENAIESAEQVRNVHYDQPFSGGPVDVGFDEYFGISASLDMVPYVYLKDRSVTKVPTVDKSFGMRSKEDSNQTRRGPGTEDFTAEDVLPRLTREAIDYLERRAASDDGRPFFLYLPYASPHTPTAPSPEWEGKSGLNAYADFVMQQDACVGQLLDALDRLKLVQNTVVLFASDNGCSNQADLPALREKGHDPVRPFRGHKADIFEGGHRVPLIVRWPGTVAAGSHTKQTVCLVDLLATVADIAHLDLPEGASPDSFSMLPILLNPNATGLRASTVHHSINGSFALRRGQFKLCFCNDSGGWSEPKPGKADPSAGVQLFDLANDIAETNNIADQHPALVLELAREMEQIITRGRSTPGPELQNDVKVDLWKRAKRPEALDQPNGINIVKPQAWQVIQRHGHVPQLSHSHNPIKPARGFADVPVSIEVPADTSKIELQVIAANDAAKVVVPWTTPNPTADQSQSSQFHASVRVPAGGWYQLQVRAYRGDQVMNAIDSHKFGVGDVFIVAGQSYATNTNEELLKVTDAYQRVAAYDLTKQSWQVANDPQPASDNTHFGSIWPIVGDMLAGSQQVPIGFANVAYGGTSSTQWLPETDLHNKLIAAGKNLQSVRGVLWQQGESDVIGKAATEDYVQRVLKIRAGAEQAWGYTTPWFLAKSTLHPVIYNDALYEGKIRAAVDVLVSQHGFQAGPDTDLLDDQYRGPVGSRRHFSALGQRQAAALWFAVLMQHLQQPKPLHEALLERLPSMALRQPAWQSETVSRESSVLLQLTNDGPIESRLAFPAAEITSIESADGAHSFKLGKDCVLSSDKYRLIWNSPTKIEVITSSQMFPPKDAPNSYRHRASNPEQNMFYAPGKFFHQHDVEISYRREKFQPTTLAAQPKLKRTLEKLRSGKSLRLGVSGDSISTGLDASGTTQTAPNQPGYPDLVAAQLTHDFGVRIELTNRAVSGWSIANGIKDLDAMLASRPELLIVAYGMNDVGRRDPAWFAEQARTFEQRAREQLPELEILWVAPMLGHSEWVHTPRAMFAAYRDELKKLANEHADLADLTEVWTEMLGHKHDLDLTGNGLNHPNDFGHRLYAQAILQCLPK